MNKIQYVVSVDDTIDTIYDRLRKSQFTLFTVYFLWEGSFENNLVGSWHVRDENLKYIATSIYNGCDMWLHNHLGVPYRGTKI